MREHFLRLWRGELPLMQAFWDYAIIYGTIANLLATLGALAALAVDAPWLALAVHFLPAPYNVVAVVGVWRSAGRYRGAPVWATAARAGVITWAVLATLA
jgi:hypothetical protein